MPITLVPFMVFVAAAALEVAGDAIIRWVEAQRGLHVVRVMRARVGVAVGLPGTGSRTHTSVGSTIVLFGSLSTTYV